MERILPDSDVQKKSLMVQRRTILLAIVAGTPADSPTLERVVAQGYLNAVKIWLDDVLERSIGKFNFDYCLHILASGSQLVCNLGSVDFLLHLLSCIVSLPVTKDAVKESGMGKIIGTIEKHPICKGSPNEAAIAKRVQHIKESWNASVKSRKATESTSDITNTSSKRAHDENVSQSSSKKVKVSSTAKKSSSFSSLVKKVSGPPREGLVEDSDDSAAVKKRKYPRNPRYCVE